MAQQLTWSKDFAKHKTLGAVPREELEWLASHGALRELNTGDVRAQKASRSKACSSCWPGTSQYLSIAEPGCTKFWNWREGEIAGLLPYSRMVTPPGDSVAQEPSLILAIPRECLRAMTRECHEITSILVHTMVDRARVFTSSDLHDEKMISLGKLSAGLAHELNNPASAIERSAALLEDRLEDAEVATRALGASRLQTPSLPL